MRATLLILFIAAGCAKSVADLSPINCTSNGLCPSPYICDNNLCIEGIHCNAMDATCPGDRPRCTLASVTETTFDGHCVAQPGNGLAGATCEMLASSWESGGFFPWPDHGCGQKHFCHNDGLGRNTDGALSHPGTCRAYCARDGDCQSGLKCLDAFGKRYLPNLSGPAPSVGICVPTCTMFTTGACAGGLTCTPALDIDGVSAFGYCVSPGIDDIGDPCFLNTLCLPTLACVPAGTGLHCLPPCKPGGTPGCAAGKTCDTTLVQMTGVGFCH